MKKPSLQVLTDLTNHINSRSPRERVMLILMIGLGVLCLDYLILIQPVIDFFSQTAPQLAVVEGDLQILKQDQKNKAVIEKQWNEAAGQLILNEEKFITSAEVPSLLESLSKQAQSSGVKITSLKPEEVAVSGSTYYPRIPIRLSALAGTHEFGKFLAQLESSATFFKVTDIKITGNPTDDRRHLIELGIETYRRE